MGYRTGTLAGPLGHGGGGFGEGRPGLASALTAPADAACSHPIVFTYLSVQTLTPESARKCERDGALAIRSYSTHGTLCDAAQSNTVRAWSMRYQTNFARHRRACRASSTSELRARHLSHIIARIQTLGFAPKGIVFNAWISHHGHDDMGASGRP